MTGKICDVHYDCFGDFEGFVLEDCCDGRLVVRGSKDLERVVLMAWRERTRVTVYYQAASHDGHAHALHASDADCCASETPAPSSPAAPDATCPWSGRPAHRDAIVELAGGVVAFCSRAHRDRFLRAVTYFREVIRYVGAPAGGRPVQSPHAGHGQQPPAHHEHGPAMSRPTHDHARTGRHEPNAIPSVNRRCPWTDKPVSASALTTFEGQTVGFHRPEDRDAFERALAAARPAAHSTSAHRDDNARHSQHKGKHHHEARPGKAAEHTHESEAVRLVRLVMHC